MGKKKNKFKTVEVSAKLIDSFIDGISSTEGVDWVDDLSEGMNMLASIHMDVGGLTTLYVLGLIDTRRYYDSSIKLVDAEVRLKNQLRSLVSYEESDDIFNEYAEY